MTILSDELTNDPLTRGYAVMTDAQVVTDMNTVYRPRPGNIQQLRRLLVLGKNRMNTGTDTTATQCWGRLEALAGATPGTSPFGAVDNVTQEQVHAAKALIEFVRSSEGSLDFKNDGEFNEILTQVRRAGAIGVDEKTAIEALSENQQTRAQELGISVNLGDVVAARA